MPHKEEFKKDKKLNKISLPRKIIVLKNVDKSEHEKWDELHKKNIANFPCPCRICVTGLPNKGKTNMIKNILLNARPLYDNVWVVNSDGPASREWDDIEPTEILTEVPEAKYFTDLSESDNKKKNILIIDDVEFTASNKHELANLYLLTRYISTHRNLTIIFSHQSFFDVPKLIRKMCNVYIIYQPRAIGETSLIEDRCGLPSGLLDHLFNGIASEFRDNICLDYTEGTPAKFRLNLFDILDIDGLSKPTYINNDLNSDDEEDYASVVSPSSYSVSV